MKNQIYDRLGDGLLVLVMLTIAFVASEIEQRFREPAPTVNAFELDADSRIVIDQDKLAELKRLSSVIETVVDLPIEVDLGLDETVPPLPDSRD